MLRVVLMACKELWTLTASCQCSYLQSSCTAACGEWTFLRSCTGFLERRSVSLCLSVCVVYVLCIITSGLMFISLSCSGLHGSHDQHCVWVVSGHLLHQLLPHLHQRFPGTPPHLFTRTAAVEGFVHVGLFVKVTVKTWQNIWHTGIISTGAKMSDQEFYLYLLCPDTL